MTKTITVLGATGSIGDSTLDLLRRAPEGAWKVVALSANRNAKKLAECAVEFKAEFVALSDASAEAELREYLQGHDVEIGIGPDALIAAAMRPADFTMAAIIGAAGLEPTLAAVSQGRTVGLANKECLVCAGAVFTQAVKRHGATLLPIDSEHNAIFQVLDTERPKGCLLYTSPSPRDQRGSRMPSSA